MSIAAYQTLYESSVAFGMRKALQAEQGKADMEDRVKELEEEKRLLDQTVLELKSKCEAIEKRENERRAMEERKHAEEIAFLKKTNLQLKVKRLRPGISERPFWPRTTRNCPGHTILGRAAVRFFSDLRFRFRPRQTQLEGILSPQKK
ncbi:MAG: axonemal dynein light chain-domain-containing protein [Olpidium bornovanus]|uniref:Axonemal dynein light chain-domain-containing protein n=1 Tax=Olpidium bornovanus TaxID=278681 RepID=A0A8H7ZWA1_9FUNG|nr:MAG: axonemal dynein light chain-domain-containing protein [Olpidium bornovanus]